jgi:hypothetical protein
MLGRLLDALGLRKSRVYCWRCGRFVRALNEWEYFRYQGFFREAKLTANEVLDRGELNEARLREIMRPLEQECERLSGQAGLDPGHLFKHRAWLYGPPCRRCGCNLRTPQARHCVVCGLERGRWQF